MQAVRDGELLELDAEVFHALLEGDPGFAVAVARTLATQLQASGGRFDPMHVAVARQCYVAREKGEAEAALARAAAFTRHTVNVSRAPGAKGGSHVLAYADTPGGTEAHALYDTADGIRAQLEAHRAAGVEYVLLTMLGGAEQLRRFARDVMPHFAAHMRKP